MPRPASKNELVTAAETNYAQLQDLLTTFSRVQMSSEFPFPHRDRCVRDVLAHLYEWHSLFLVWYAEGMKNQIVSMPAPGYTWKETPRLNNDLHLKHRLTSLRCIRSKLQESHWQIMDLMKSHTNRELYERNRYSWTGSATLGSYFTSATSAHYHWASKLLRKHKRLCS